MVKSPIISHKICYATKIAMLITACLDAEYQLSQIT